MLKRFELHNHTTESDAGIDCAALFRHMKADRVDVFAITDHNTVSGHRIIRGLVEGDASIQAVYGMEYTTYYGHILCLNLRRYVPWDSIDRHHPELLFDACRAAGALAGIAHPFSYGDPFARGCRFEMTVTDFSRVDFIEIMNNPEPLERVNGPAIEWWESLVLRGERLAATAGMDLHGPWDMSMKYATYVEGEPGGDPARELETAIRAQRTWVSNGLALMAAPTADGLRFEIVDLKKPGFIPPERCVMTLRGARETREYAFDGPTLTVPFAALPEGDVLIPKLYGDRAQLDRLICVAPALRMKD